MSALGNDEADFAHELIPVAIGYAKLPSCVTVPEWFTHYVAFHTISVESSLQMDQSLYNIALKVAPNRQEASAVGDCNSMCCGQDNTVWRSSFT